MASTEDDKQQQQVQDEYGFVVEERYLESFHLFDQKHQQRKIRLATVWKDIKLTNYTTTHNRKKLADLIHSGVPKDQRILVFLSLLW